MTGSTIIVPQYITAITEHSTVKLARYAQIIGYDENPFWGINHLVDDRCRHIWTLDERAMVAKYLGEAQSEIEPELNFLIGAQWTVEDKKPYHCPMFTRWGFVRAFGVEHIDNVDIASAVNHAADPVIIGPIATTVTVESEIVIYHPGTDIEITPGTVVIAGGNVTITIPMCRMVASAFVDNPEVGWDYGDYATVWGEHTVDVKRRWNDTTTQVVLSSNHNCNSICASTGCSTYTQTACGYIKNPRLGQVEVYPSDYASGTWIKKSCLCSGYDEAQLNYFSGVDITAQLEDMIIRLAHSKMPKEPCACDPLRDLWERDTKVPDMMSASQAGCKFGTSNGAFIVWQWTQSLRLVRGGIVG